MPIFSRYRVQGGSMLPLFSDGDRLLIWHSKQPRKGDAIVFRDARSATSNNPPDSAEHRTYLKRVAALPGEIAPCWGIPYQLNDSEFYVLGDNATASTDSRTFGPINRDRIIGIAILKYYPSLAWVKKSQPPY
ncbi:MAG: S26 family signal peptidase [Synechococcus sp.]